MPEALSLTPSALAQVRLLLAKTSAGGLRIGVKTKGCTGLAYTMEYAEAKAPEDEEVRYNGVTLFIDAKALLYILGTEMDFMENELQSGFVFRNPNAKGHCGCGKSFHI